MLAAVWGSPFVVDGKVYLGDEDGDVVVLQHGKEKKVLAEMNMGSAVYSTVVPANGAIILNNRNQLFSLAREVTITHHRATEAQRPQKALSFSVSLCLCGLSRGAWRSPLAAADWPQFRGNPRLTGVASTRRPPPSRSSGPTSSATCPTRRRRSPTAWSTRVRPTEPGRPRSRHRQAAVEVLDRRPARHRRILARGGRRRRLRRRSRRHRPRRQRRRRNAAVDVQDRLRDQVVAHRRQRPRPDRLVRYAPLRARREDRHAAVEVPDEGPGARHALGAGRRRFFSPAATSCFAPFASPTGGRSTRFRPAPTPARHRSSMAIARISARSTTR